MYHTRFVPLGLCLALSTVLCAQSTPDAAIFAVHAGAFGRTDTPVCTRFAGAAESTYHLVETTGGSEEPVDLQQGADELCWRLKGDTPAGEVRTFALRTGPSGNDASPAVAVDRTDGKAIFRLGDSEVLTYQDAKADVPEGVDPLYSRGGFIHPLRTPGGATVTRIQPPDHYHHYGVWGPWTHTRFRGRQIDFWNIGDGQGTVEARGIEEASGGTLYGNLRADLTFLAFRDSAVTEDPIEVLDEEVDLRVYAAPESDPGYLVDYTQDQTNITEDTLTVEAYRYQGFSIRATPEWNDDNVTLITSEGYNKADGNATRARWVNVSGPTEAGPAGVLMMTHPDNFNYPEQIRIWPTGANEGKENVFVNFNPAQDRDYILRPGAKNRLRYRMYVYDGQLDTVAANRYWQDFAYPPRVVRTDAGNELRGKKVLLYTRNGQGYVHENIPASVEAIEQLGREQGFEVTATEDPSVFTPEGLAQYDVLVFSNTNNKVFDTAEQREALQGYIRGGGGFVGIHSACGTERDWPWFARMLGSRFYRHPPRQNFDVVVLDDTHPSTDFLPPTWHIRDEECYYMTHLNPENQVLLAVELTSVEDDRQSEYPGDTFGNLFPAAWSNTYDGGRQWYTALGHRSEVYRDPLFREHLLGGIRWAASKP